MELADCNWWTQAIDGIHHPLPLAVPASWSRVRHCWLLSHGLKVYGHAWVRHTIKAYAMLLPPIIHDHHFWYLLCLVPIPFCKTSSPRISTSSYPLTSILMDLKQMVQSLILLVPIAKILESLASEGHEPPSVARREPPTSQYRVWIAHCVATRTLLRMRPVWSGDENLKFSTLSCSNLWFVY